MMYESKMALAVKSKGRVLRESRDGDSTTVYLPFGCEFSLMLKNLNSVRALAKVWIDGTDVTEGTSGLIVPPNQSIDLERFIKNGNLSAGNKFKFIERTRQISNHRGNKIDDGLIRVEFEFERQNAPIVSPYWNVPNTLLGGHQHYGTTIADSYTVSTSDTTGGSLGDVSYSANAASTSNDATLSSTGAFINQSKGILRSSAASTSTVHTTFNAPQNAAPKVETDVGITVPGAVSDQSFTWGSWFPTDGVKHVMIMAMLGDVDGAPIVAPVTVHAKPECTTCGKINRATAKFCSECGTGLNLVVDHSARADHW